MGCRTPCFAEVVQYTCSIVYVSGCLKSAVYTFSLDLTTPSPVEVGSNPHLDYQSGVHLLARVLAASWPRMNGSLTNLVFRVWGSTHHQDQCILGSILGPLFMQQRNSPIDCFKLSDMERFVSKLSRTALRSSISKPNPSTPPILSVSSVMLGFIRGTRKYHSDRVRIVRRLINPDPRLINPFPLIGLILGILI